MNLGWSHVTLTFGLLVIATSLSALLAALGAYFFATRRPGARRSGSIYTATVVGLHILAGIFPVFLSWSYLFVANPALGGSSVAFCFGEPHWNMPVAAGIPPFVGLAVYFLSRRFRDLENISGRSNSKVARKGA